MECIGHSCKVPFTSKSLTFAFPLPKTTFGLLPSASSLKWVLRSNFLSKSTNLDLSLITWLVAPVSKSKFGVISPLLSSSLIVKIKLWLLESLFNVCSLRCSASFDASLFPFRQSLALWEVFLFLMVLTHLRCGLTLPDLALRNNLCEST